MGKWVIYFIFIIFTGFTYGVNAQEINPPPPVMQSTEDAPICDQYDNDPTTPEPPPPPGLPCVTLPIDDYVIPLLFCGIVFGAIALINLQSKHEVRNSAQ